jgi:hypothetical protein
LNVLSKLGNQGLEWRLEPKAFTRGEVGGEDDLLDVLVGCPVDIQVARHVLVLHERKSRVTLAARLTGKTAAETISAMLAVFGRIDPSSAKINHLRQRHRFRPARPAQDHARHDDLVLRRLCLMAKRRHRKRQWTLTAMASVFANCGRAVAHVWGSYVPTTESRAGLTSRAEINRWYHSFIVVQQFHLSLAPLKSQ